MTVSIIIPALNEEKYLGACLRSLALYTTKDVAEIIVIDNGSSDRTAEIAGSFPGVRVVEEPIKGLTRARQKGLEEAKGDLLAYIDADTQILSSRWFEIIGQEFLADPTLVCLSGPYHYTDLTPAQTRMIAAYENVVYPSAYKITGHMVFGGNFVAKKSALLKIGGFNKDIEFYGEDTDIALRLHNVGKVKFDKEFCIQTSGRRLVNEGIVRTGIKYALNFFWLNIFRKPLTKKHKNIR